MVDNSKREAVNIALLPPAREILEDLREDTGVPKTEAMTRILEWFLGLDRKFRLAVLTRDVDTRRELTRLVLSEMAGSERADPSAPFDAPVTIEQAVRISRLMLDHVERLSAARARARADVQAEGETKEKAPAKRRGR